MGMRDEILEQPAVAARLLATGLPVIEAIARAIQSREIEFVLIAGRGTSDHAGVYAQYIFGTRNDLPVALAAPSLLSIYEARPRLRHALVIGISQSGRSPDVVGVVEDGRRQGALTLAVTNDRSSPLASAGTTEPSPRWPGALIAEGVPSARACRMVGIHPRTGKRWRNGLRIPSGGRVLNFRRLDMELRRRPLNGALPPGR